MFKLTTKLAGVCSLLLVFVSLDIHADISFRSFVIATDKNNLPSVEGQIYIENNFKELELDLSSIKSSLLSDSNILSRYYSAAIKNNVSEMQSMSFVSDGSLSWMKEELKATPDKFQGFRNLEKVTLKNRFYWGGYTIWSVDWYVQRNKFAAKWFETTICIKAGDCYISNLLLNGSTESSIFSQAIIELSKSKKISTDLPVLPYSVNYSPQYGSQNKPFVVKYKINWFDKPFLISKTEKNASTEDSLLRLKDFFSAILNLKKLDSASSSAKIHQYDEVFKKYWESFSSSALLPVFKVKDGVVFHYPYNVFADFIKRGDVLRVFSTLDGGSEIYLVCILESEQQKSIIILDYSVVDKKFVQHSNNDFLGAIIATPNFGRSIQNLITERMGKEYKFE